MAKKSAVPNHVVILGLGPSLDQYSGLVKRLGSRKKLCDEVWTINALGDLFQCDRVFHMDDVRIQQVRADASPESNIAAMLAWLKTTKTPVFTSRPHPDYPSLLPYPLEDVTRSAGYAYFNNTAAYAVAYAVHIGVKRLTVMGCDFTYPNAHHAEQGRGCVEFWLGMGAARGMQIQIPRVSSLMDGCVPEDQKLYGYDTLEVLFSKDAKGKLSVKTKPRTTPLPSAEDVEHRYDHNRHSSPQLR
jgi:hypothetical protein